jgi:hypothetical protein
MSSAAIAPEGEAMQPIRRIAIAVVVLLAGAEAGRAEPFDIVTSTSPGHQRVYVSRRAGEVDCSSPGVRQFMTGEIVEAVAGRMLVVHGAVSVFRLLTSKQVLVTALVNGVQLMNPGEAYLNQCRDDVGTCLVSGVFHLDLDAAEAARPGTFIGKPLVVELRVDTSVDGCTIQGAMTISMEADAPIPRIVPPGLRR